MKRGLGFSLLLHLLLGVIAIGWIARRKPPTPAAPTPMIVSLKSNGPGLGQRPQARSVHPRGRASAPPAARSDFSPSVASLFRVSGLPDGKTPEAYVQPRNLTGEPGSGSLRAGNAIRGEDRFEGGFGTGEIYADLGASRWLQSLYNRLNDNLIYPSEIADAGIEGRVGVELKFGVDSPRVEIGKVNADSPYLRVLVMRAIRRTLQDPLPDDLSHVPQRQTVQAHFEFALKAVMDNPQAVADQQLRAGRKFIFYRQGVAHVLEWQAGPLHGVWGVPSVGLDPLWFYQKIRDRHRARIDPLAPYRQDPDFVGS